MNDLFRILIFHQSMSMAIPISIQSIGTLTQQPDTGSALHFELSAPVRSNLISESQRSINM